MQTCQKLGKTSLFAPISTDHRHHGFDSGPNDEVVNGKSEVSVALLKICDDTLETDDADNASGRAHRKYER